MGEIFEACPHFDECIPFAAESKYSAHDSSFLV
jgi:hypothetical protein